MQLNDFLQRFQGVVKAGGNGQQYAARCPAHDDKNASLSIGFDNDRILLHCHARCATADILRAVGLRAADLFANNDGNGAVYSTIKATGRVVAAYDYRDESGELLFQSLRYEPKKFRQRSPNGKGGWRGTLDNVRRVLYRLPELIAASPAAVVYIPEGEKDVDGLHVLGFTATCNPCGAGKWRDEYSGFLRGRDVVVLPDNDKTGRDHAQQVAQSSSGIAKSIKVVELPGLPDKGDVSDFLAAGGTVEALAELVAAAPEWSSCTAPTAVTSLPEVNLPGGATTITSAAGQLGTLLAATGRFFCRGGSPVRLLEIDDETRLEPMRAPALCSDFEMVANLVRMVQTKDGEQVTATNCSESGARLILESAVFRAALPPIRVISRCPVLIERDGRLVTVSGYDRESAIFAIGEQVPEIPLPDALELLAGLLSEFRFATPGDEARAMIAFITPALVFGGLLNGRAPVDLSEADDSQAGKGYRNKITAAIYNSRPRAVTQRATGGVGSVQENFDSALVSGACFVPFDNFRGRLDLPGLESFLTEDSYLARVPYASPMAIDPRRVIVMFTSNSAEVTVDLANRCSCTRILKQTVDYEFAKYTEGDLLDHVLANQPQCLGAVFAVVREWHRRGKPELDTAGHDFRRWARVLGYISENILGTGGLLVGHREAQQRIASPGLTWLRDVALAVQRAGKAAQWLRAHQLLEILADVGLEDADTGEHDAWLKAVQSLGRKLGRVFKTDVVTIDNFRIVRKDATDEQWRRQREYAFFSEPLNTPEYTPESKPETPEYPESLASIFREPTPTHIDSHIGNGNIEVTGPIRGIRGTSGEMPTNGFEEGDL